LQVQHYLAVTGFQVAFVAVLIGGNTFKWLKLERDEELIEMMIILEEAFWEHVVTKTSPPLDGSEASVQLLNRLYPKSNAKSTILLSGEAMEWIEQYEEASELEKKYAEQKEEASNTTKINDW
jgi:predicted phage-related endonuclease